MEQMQWHTQSLIIVKHIPVVCALSVDKVQSAMLILPPHNASLCATPRLWTYRSSSTCVRAGMVDISDLLWLERQHSSLSRALTDRLPDAGNVCVCVCVWRIKSKGHACAQCMKMDEHVGQTDAVLSLGSWPLYVCVYVCEALYWNHCECVFACGTGVCMHSRVYITNSMMDLSWEPCEAFQLFTVVEYWWLYLSSNTFYNANHV